ncbi:MAG TPA: NADH-quinone oxidoreductase subunit NuoK [Planctomycetota bacterium]|nr:NADH-quinone oxidoreductase subunit NuoK [Planctomycetota bacterium]
MQPIGLHHYLVVAAILFALGLAVVLTRRNAIAVLCGLELILNAAGLNFVAFNRFAAPERVDGQIFTIFIMILAAAEAATALAIVLNIYHALNTVRVDEVDALKE